MSNDKKEQSQTPGFSLVNSAGDEGLHGKSIPDCIFMERTNQIAQWGMQEHHDFKWNSILNEEVGEVARCVNEMNPSRQDAQVRIQAAGMQLEHELVQVAAVCVAWIECIRHRRLIINEQIKAAQEQEQRKAESGPGDNTDEKGKQ